MLKCASARDTARCCLLRPLQARAPFSKPSQFLLCRLHARATARAVHATRLPDWRRGRCCRHPCARARARYTPRLPHTDFVKAARFSFPGVASYSDAVRARGWSARYPERGAATQWAGHATLKHDVAASAAEDVPARVQVKEALRRATDPTVAHHIVVVRVWRALLPVLIERDVLKDDHVLRPFACRQRCVMHEIPNVVTPAEICVGVPPAPLKRQKTIPMTLRELPPHPGSRGRVRSQTAPQAASEHVLRHGRHRQHGECEGGKTTGQQSAEASTPPTARAGAVVDNDGVVDAVGSVPHAPHEEVGRRDYQE